MTGRAGNTGGPAKERRRVLIAAALLVAAVFAAFSPLLTAEFVNYDDQVYVTDNARVRSGLSVANVGWAFANVDFGFYYPLTWVSHMLDCQIWGLWAPGHHLTSLAIHAGSSVLLLLFFLWVSGEFWPSLLVAALFALHPLHVESVAWISERKDVLSTFFLFAAFLAYARYVRRPAAGPYAAVFAALLLGLLAKSMVVTAPILLLLMDAWPLGRAGGAGVEAGAGGDALAALRARASVWAPLVREKIPLFALSLLFGVLTIYAQNKAGAVNPLQAVPFWLRFENAVVGCATYLVKMVAPVDLAVLYPIPGDGWPWTRVILSLLLLLAVSALAWRLRKGRPYLAVGWLWTLASVAPVSGLLQVGQQAYADRYTYVPLVGVFVMVAWGLRDATAGLGARGKASAFAAVLAAVACLGMVTRHQCLYWQNGTALFTHTLAAGGANEGMLNSLGLTLIQEGKPQEAIPLLKRATLLNSRSINAWGNLGDAFREVGKLREAAACYRRVLDLEPGETTALYQLGKVLEEEGDGAGALEAFGRRAGLLPDDAGALTDWGRLLSETGNAEAAAKVFGRAVHLAPQSAGAWDGLARARLAAPPSSRDDLAVALDAAEKACYLTHGEDVPCLLTLLEARRRAGDLAGARRAGERALSVLGARPDEAARRAVLRAMEALGTAGGERGDGSPSIPPGAARPRR